MTTHGGIRGGGLDATPNAIAGDASSLLATQMIAMHNWPALDPDSITAAVLADSIVNWIVNDSLRQY
jgi:hypothetical protein